jgi:hypothetical protein
VWAGVFQVSQRSMRDMLRRPGLLATHALANLYFAGTSRHATSRHATPRHVTEAGGRAGPGHEGAASN